MWRDLGLLVGLPLVLATAGLVWWAPWKLWAAKVSMASLAMDTVQLDSLAASLGGDGWRRRRPEECDAAHCGELRSMSLSDDPYTAPGDFNSDGIADVAFALTDETRDYVVWFQGDSGGFASPQLLMTVGEPSLRSSGLHVVGDTLLQVWDLESGQLWYMYEWDPKGQSLQIVR